MHYRCKITVSIGTNDKIEKLIRENLKYLIRVSIVSNLEFLAQGTAVRDIMHPSRIVIGGENEKAIIKMKELYTINVQKCFQQVSNGIYRNNILLQKDRTPSMPL